MVGVVEISGAILLLSITYVVVSDFLAGEAGLPGLAMVGLFWAIVLATDVLHALIFAIVRGTGGPIQRILAEFGIYTSPLIAGAIGFVVAFMLFFEMLDRIDPKQGADGSGEDDRE